jgi:RNA polymerase sigma factor (TIGR02999 family)
MAGLGMGFLSVETESAAFADSALALCWKRSAARVGSVDEKVPLTEWLRAAGGGDHSAGDRAFAAVYAELRRLAARQLRHARATLTPTVLVNETYLKLAGGALVSLNDRRHFFNLAARAMRQTVIDHARELLADKRGGDLVQTRLDDDVPAVVLDVEQALAYEQALCALEKQDAHLAETLNWYAFAGLGSAQIAELHGVTERTVQRELVLARNYLRLSLGRSA